MNLVKIQNPRRSLFDQKTKCKEAIAATSKMRTDPQSFVPILEQMLGWFDGNTMWEPGQTGLMTNEGPSAVQEAIDFLKRQKPVGGLKWKDSLYGIAQSHADYLSGTGSISHDGSKLHPFISQMEIPCLQE